MATAAIERTEYRCTSGRCGYEYYVVGKSAGLCPKCGSCADPTAATWPDVLRDHERDAADASLFEAMTHVGQAHDELCALRASVLLGDDARSATVRALDLATARLAFALTATDLVAPRPPCPLCHGTRTTHPTGDPADAPESCPRCALDLLES